MIKVISRDNRYVRILETKDNGRLRIRRAITHEEYEALQQEVKNPQVEDTTMAEVKQTKVALLEAVETFNDTLNPQPLLRVKSKTTPVIVQTLNAALAAIDPLELYTKGEVSMFDVFASYDVDLPEVPKKKAIKKYKKQMKKNEGMSAQVVINEDKDAFAEESKEEKKARKAEAKAEKKAEKAQQAADQEAREAWADEVDVLQKFIDDPNNKKKKRKKAKKALKLLMTENPTTTEATAKPKDKTKPTRGATSRADRAIPNEPSFPKEGNITWTILKACSKKAKTLDQILDTLAEKFPERPVEGMKKTLHALVGGKGEPLPITWTKGIHMEVNNDGTPERTVKLVSPLP